MEVVNPPTAIAPVEHPGVPQETNEVMETLRLYVQQLEAENLSMRRIVLRMAEARMCRDNVTMVESCPHCSLKRGGEYGYSGKHDEACLVTLARKLGF